LKEEDEARGGDIGGKEGGGAEDDARDFFSSEIEWATSEVLEQEAAAGDYIVVQCAGHPSQKECHGVSVETEVTTEEAGFGFQPGF
jgi:hypothetical protein